MNTSTAIHSAILWHESQIKELRSQLPTMDLQGAILQFASSQYAPFNGAQVHRAVCPWAARTSANQALIALAAKGKIIRVGDPGSVTVKNGTKAAWYMRKDDHAD